MAYVALPTVTAGQIATEAWANQNKANWDASANAVVTTAGDLLYATAAGVLARLAVGAAGQFLSVAGGVPVWATIPADPAAGTAGLRTLGAGAQQAAAGNHTHGYSALGHTHPESDVTSLVTDLANRSLTSHTHAGPYAPTAHIASHVSGGSDPFTTAHTVTIGTVNLGTALIASGVTVPNTGRIRLGQNEGVWSWGPVYGNVQVVRGFDDAAVLGNHADANHCGFVAGTSGFSWYIASSYRYTLDINGLYPQNHNARTCGGNGNAWSAVWAVNGTIQTSSEAAKEHLHRFSPAAALRLARSTGVYAFRYKGDDGALRRHVHIGFVAERTHRLLTLDGKSASPQSTASVALAAVVGLGDELHARIAALEIEVALLRRRLAA